MPFQSVPNCAKVAIEGSLGSKQLVNVLHFKFAGTYGQSDIDALAQAVDNAVGSDYLPIITAGATYSQSVATGLENINDLTATDATNAGAGTSGGASLPNNVSFVVTLRTGLTGRSARGRFYCWPMGAGDLFSANTVTVALANQAVAFLQQVQLNAAAVNWALGIVSRRTLGAVRPTGVFFPVNDIAYRNLLTDSQRGRLPIGH